MGEQNFIQIRVDSELKQNATDILNEIGLDMPNAIRMFLKRIVLERGLPFDAKLPEARASGSEEPDANGAFKAFLATLPVNNPLMQEYIDLLSLVPAGKITRSEDIQSFMAKRHGVEDIQVEFSANYRNPLWEGIPVWREVTKYGMLREFRYCSRDRQASKLREEGLNVVPCGAHQQSLKVEDYKEYLFDFSTLLMSAIDECPGKTEESKR